MKMHRLFDVRIHGDNYTGKEFWKTCVLVKGKVARKDGNKIRPFLIDVPDDVMEVLEEELYASKGTLTRRNYKMFLPYMLEIGRNQNDIIVRDLTADVERIQERRRRKGRWD